MAESSTPKPQPGSREPSFSPVLEGALANLMVDLDDELQRYRQRRSDQTGVSAPGPQSRFRRAQRSAPQLINLPGVPTGTAPKVPPATIASQQPASLPGGRPIPPPPPPRSALTSKDLIPYSPMAEDYLESTEALLDTDPTAYITDYGSEAEDRPPSLGRSLATPLGLGSLLLLLVASAGFGYLVTSPQAIDHLRLHPLVKGLGQKVAPTTINSSPTHSEAGAPVPEGLGPDLSEQEFAPLDLNRLSNLPRPTPHSPEAPPLPDPAFQPEQLQPPRAPQKPAGLSSITPTAPSQGEILPGPTVSTPSRLPSSTPREISPSPSRRTSEDGLAPVKVAPVGQGAQPPRPLIASAPAQPPAPLAQPQAAAPPAPLRPSARYYVVMDYSGDASLAAARQVVGDAYIRNFNTGAKIQMGAFSERGAADTLVKQLQRQGVAAQVIGF